MAIDEVPNEFNVIEDVPQVGRGKPDTVGVPQELCHEETVEVESVTPHDEMPIDLKKP